MTPAKTPYLPDLGNGQYQNPVLFADYSDPDAIRVGEDYWMTASSFSHAPGLPILHSKDLINWSLVGHALPRLVPDEHFCTPRHGCGVWAPALRHHAGKFWIFYPDPDFGIYVITADDPRGPWSEPKHLKAGRGIIDPCPLWDDDGRAWMIHGWARSRAGINNLLTLHEISPEADRLLDAGVVVIDANKLPGWKTLEGPKLHKHRGYYWVSAPAGGVAEGHQVVFRSKSITGPYEPRIVLDQGSTPINGPHQGAWVDTPDGKWWFFHFQELPALGRVVHLQPMRWLDDNWPVMGLAPEGATKGEPALVHEKPFSSLHVEPTGPEASDDFASGHPGLQWQWQCNPSAEWLGTATSGSLRLNCVSTLPEPSKEVGAANWWNAGNLLLQKFPRPDFSCTTSLRLEGASEGDLAGLILFGYNYLWTGLVKTAEGMRLQQVRCVEANKGASPEIVLDLPFTGSELRLKAQMCADRSVTVAWSTEGKTWNEISSTFTATSSQWVGGKIGLTAQCSPGQKSEGYAQFGCFQMLKES